MLWCDLGGRERQTDTERKIGRQGQREKGDQKIILYGQYVLIGRKRKYGQTKKGERERMYRLKEG